MTFRTKIVTSIWGVVLSLLVITFFIINYWTRGRIEGTFERELRSDFSSVQLNEKLQSAHLIRADVVIAESPRLRAAIETGNQKTAYELSQELSRTTRCQVYVLTDRGGRPLVQLLRGARDQWDVSSYATIRDALRYIASSDVWAVRGNVYRVVSVPILIQAELVGTLTIGFEITLTELASLKRATNTDLVLASNGTPALSTLDPSETRALVPDVAFLPGTADSAEGDTLPLPYRLSANDETYLCSTVPLHHPSGTDSTSVYYLLIKPLSREVRQSMESVLGTFGLVSLAFLALTTIVGIVISKSMTRPIQELVKGTTEISRGNYDYAIHVGGRDELGLLANRFMEMSSSLKEKITELGRLNKDLLDRNRDLDETLRKLQSAQEELLKSERLAATGKMTAQLAHEINNPIHNIQSLLESSQRKIEETNSARELISVALEEVSRLAKLTRQMLEFYRGSVVDMERVEVDLAGLLNELVESNREQLDSHGVKVLLEVPRDLPTVHGSRDKLKQVFLNLILNARDAMPDGGQLALRANVLRGAVRVEVTDTGVGIPPENIGRIFDAFFTTKKEVSGVGLGLSVSYGIVQQHKGSIYVSSTVGKGTTFAVQLPAGAGPDSAAHTDELRS